MDRLSGRNRRLRADLDSGQLGPPEEYFVDDEDDQENEENGGGGGRRVPDFRKVLLAGR